MSKEYKDRWVKPLVNPPVNHEPEPQNPTRLTPGDLKALKEKGTNMKKLLTVAMMALAMTACSKKSDSISISVGECYGLEVASPSGAKVRISVKVLKEFPAPAEAGADAGKPAVFLVIMNGDQLAPLVTLKSSVEADLAKNGAVKIDCETLKPLK